MPRTDRPLTSLLPSVTSLHSLLSPPALHDALPIASHYHWGPLSPLASSFGDAAWPLVSWVTLPAVFGALSLHPTIPPPRTASSRWGPARESPLRPSRSASPASSRPALAVTFSTSAALGTLAVPARTSPPQGVDRPLTPGLPPFFLSCAAVSVHRLRAGSVANSGVVLSFFRELGSHCRTYSPLQTSKPIINPPLTIYTSTSTVPLVISEYAATITRIHVPVFPSALTTPLLLPPSARRSTSHVFLFSSVPEPARPHFSPRPNSMPRLAIAFAYSSSLETFVWPVPPIISCSMFLNLIYFTFRLLDTTPATASRFRLCEGMLPAFRIHLLPATIKCLRRERRTFAYLVCTCPRKLLPIPSQ
nr:hypothetical protein Iba_chr02fCG13820 [Ipomoea batatas]